MRLEGDAHSRLWHKFQFTHPVRGATVSAEAVDMLLAVSIHTPREGCDYQRSTLKEVIDVSIHAPREGCDSTYIEGSIHDICFNSRTP